ncbi:hypothetical protein [Marinobacter caseinilyticus]|uniref:hypothetical protein n=1 Tax=Marinobacter caseinilyticus TaxID=2692195 RepID=UPI00140E8583|nr:hypothetical protein [Marinobacter caseinilyticus]
MPVSADPILKTPFGIIILIASLTVFCLSSLGQPTNWLLHDILIGDLGLKAIPKERPLLVKMNTESDFASGLETLVDQLSVLNAREIILLPPLSQAPLPGVTEQHPSTKVTRAMDTSSCDVSDAGQLTTNPQTPQLATVVPRFAYGAHRFIPPLSNHGCVGYSESPILSDHQSVNFLYLNAGLPLVGAEQVRSGALIPELVAAKTVLIGAVEPHFASSFRTPTTDGTLSYLQLQGLIWETQVNQAAVLPTPMWQTLLAVFLLTCFNLLIFQPLTTRQALAVSTILVAAILTLAAFLLKARFQVLPVTELGLSQIACLVFIRQIRWSRIDKAMESMLTEAQSLLAERLTPTEFHQTENPWSQIIVLINQQLNLNRSILLEKVPQDHRVREIQALNCSLDHIAEKRRDYQRKPYSDAIELAGPLQLTGTYFKDVTEGELEYIAPLMFGNQILGFWALTVKTDAQWNREAFEHNIANFSRQIAELVYHRDQWQRDQRRNKSKSHSILTLQGGRQVHTELEGALFLLQKRLDELEDVFSGLSSAAVLFNLFGQIKLVNHRMESLANQAGLTLYKTTAVELLSHLCEISLDAARRHLRHVTLKQLPVTLTVRRMIPDKRFVLNMRPIRPDADTQVGDLNAREVEPFELVGILFELVDVSHTEQLLFLRDDLYGQFARELKNQLNRITLAVTQIARLNDADPQRPVLVDTVDQSVSLSVQLLENLGKKYRNDNEDSDFKMTAPVNAIRVLQEAETACSKLLERSRVTFKKQFPISTNLISVDGERLKLVILSIIELLAKDGVPDSQITIMIKEQSRDGKLQTCIFFNNEGYGMPQSTLDAILARDASMLLGSSDQVEHCIGILRTVEYYGGTFTVQSEVGNGFRISLCFRGVKLLESDEER